jgi:hypothetical protein
MLRSRGSFSHFARTSIGFSRCDGEVRFRISRKRGDRFLVAAEKSLLKNGPSAKLFGG